MKITNGVAHDLVVTSMDITSLYGKTTLPAVWNIPMYQSRFKDIGIDNLSPKALSESLHKIKNTSNIQKVLNFLSDRLGYNHAVPKLKETGQTYNASWGLISKARDSFKGWSCQSLFA